MIPRSARRGLAAAAVAGLLAGCGSTGRLGLSAVEQSQLLGMIAQARSAAAAGDTTGAETWLTELRSTVSQLRTAGVLDPARAARMQSVAAQALSAARAQAVARAVPPTSAAPAAPAPAAPTRQATQSAHAAPSTPAATGPVGVVVQGVGALKARVDRAVGKGVAKLKDSVAGLEQGLTGQGKADGRGHGGGGGH